MGECKPLLGAINTGGWFTNTSYLDSAGNFNPALATAGSHMIYYTFTDGNGCTETDSTTILIDTIPDASIAAAGPFCENGGMQLITPVVNTGGLFTNASYLDSAGNFNPAIATAGSHQVYYTYTDGNGCTDTDSTTILVDTIPDASITPAGPFCENGGIQTLSGAINTGGWFTNTSYLDSAGNFDPAIAKAGSHQVYYTFTDGNGCTDTDSTTILVDTVPDASITPAGPFCENGGIQALSAAVNIGGWFTNTSYLDSAGNFNPALATAGSHQVYYTFMDGNGCAETDSTTILIDTIPDASITAAGPFCENGGIQTLSGAINTGGWFTNTSYLDSAGNFDPAIAKAGSHQVYYTFTDGNGCTDTDSTTILVDTIPDASITPAGPFCENGGIQTLSGAINTGGWFTNTSYLDSVGNFDPAIAQAGSHQVYYTFTDGNGCTDSDSTTILVDTVPDASITAAGPFCENGGIQTLSGAINTGGWFTNTSYIDSAGNFNPALATAGSHLIYYTFTDGNGCTETDSTTILVDTIPDASITAGGPFCENVGMQTLSGVINTGGWFTNTSYLDSAGNFNPAVAQAGSHLIYYTFTDGNGCTETDSTTILVDTIPDASITSAGPFCENSGMQSLSGSINTRGWFTNTSYLDSAGNFNPALATAGSHQVYYTFTDGNGCTNTDSTTILVDTIPDASITSAGPFCENAGMQTLIGAVNTGGQFSTTTYLDNAGNFDPATATHGDYLIYYTFIDGNGCSNTDSMTITVHPTEDPTITAPTSLCVNDDPIQLSSASTLGNFGGGSYISQTGMFSPSLASIGNNIVWYDVTNSYGCRTADTVEITILEAPTNEIIIDPIEGCDPLEVTVSTAAADSIIWNMDGTMVYNQETITDTYSAGTYTVSLRAKNGLGCEVVRDSSFVVYPNPIADFSYSPEKIYISNPNVQFEDLSTGTVVDWYWDFGNGFNAGQQNPNHTYTAGGSYNVVLLIEDENGCVDSAEQTLIVKDELLALIPTAFTPNGDGLNDVFRLSGLGYEEVKIKIYSRWGELIYASDNFQQWDGKYKGEVVQNGVYVYIITIKDSRGYNTHRSGEVHVLR
jgi:gliding motility-associated-like protein